MIHVKYCKKCKKAYDTMSCPYCNKKNIELKQSKLKKEKLK